MSSKASLTIVIADDTPTTGAPRSAESRLANPRVYVEDGEELLEYLRGEGKFANQPRRLPGLILLDLNMPRMDGRTVLKHIKDDPELRRVPVIVLTTSKAEEDILRTYDLGVSSFITKPA